MTRVRLALFFWVIVEIPYKLIQAVAYVIITYPMIGYYWSMYKIFWNFYAIFCTILYLSYLGMLLVSLTPSVMVASIIFSAFYTTFNLFSGFLIPKPVIKILLIPNLCIEQNRNLKNIA